MNAPRRNKFDLSHERKFSCNMGALVPILVQEALPGDSFRVNTEIAVRMAPMLAPIMHRVNVKTEYFSVPYRLIWDEWEDFITGGRLGTAAPVTPKLSMATVDAVNDGRLSIGSLWDYMGLPTIAPTQTGYDGFIDIPVSALPFRAYQLIYNEYYRDQNVTAELDISKSSGIQDATQTNLLTTWRQRAWEHDYFTSCLPFAQRGPAVGIPIGGFEDVPLVANETGSSSITLSGTAQPGSVSVGFGVEVDSSLPDLALRAKTSDLQTANANINDLRRSIRLQEWLERAARVGGRYIEVLKGFFGVKPDDARLQRPEYLGGTSTPMQISEVLSTVQQVDPTTGDNIGNPQGDMSGRGISVGGRNGFTHFFKEHCIVIGIMSVIPKTAYQQGIERMWTRDDKFDYYWEQFAHIGEQEVKNQELFFNSFGGYTTNPTFPQPDETFGYQSRYAEYKYKSSTVHGSFREELNFWHMGRIFPETNIGGDPIAGPVLNTAFVQSSPTDRIFAVQTDVDHLWVHLYHNFSAIRPMPYFGTPTI